MSPRGTVELAAYRGVVLSSLGRHQVPLSVLACGVDAKDVEAAASSAIDGQASAA